MCRVRNWEILKVGAVSFYSRSLEFAGKTIGCHTEHFSMVWMFSNVFKRCMLGRGKARLATQLHTSLVTNPSDINDFTIAYLVDN